MMRWMTFVLALLALIALAGCDVPTVPNQVSRHTVTPDNGTHNPQTEIVMNSTVSGVTIRYTVDGTDPTDASSVYQPPLMLGDIMPMYSNRVTLKSRSFKDGKMPSNVVTRDYQVAYTNTVSAPEITPPAGSVMAGTLVFIEVNTPNSIIRYTLDDSEPTLYSPLYVGPISITQSGLVIIKARAFRNLWNPSPVTTAYLTYPNLPPGKAARRP